MSQSKKRMKRKMFLRGENDKRVFRVNHKQHQQNTWKRVFRGKWRNGICFVLQLDSLGKLSHKRRLSREWCQHALNALITFYVFCAVSEKIFLFMLLLIAVNLLMIFFLFSQCSPAKICFPRLTTSMWEIKRKLNSQKIVFDSSLIIFFLLDFQNFSNLYKYLRTEKLTPNKTSRQTSRSGNVWAS